MIAFIRFRAFGLKSLICCMLSFMIKNCNLFLLLLLTPLLGIGQDKEITLRIGQDQSITLHEFESQATFSKKSLKIQVLLDKVKGVYCYASFSDSIYKLGEQDAIPGFADLPNMAMAEEKFNDEKELMISKNGWSYWFYDSSMNWHRFNKKIVFMGSGRLVATKTIKQLYFVEERKEIKLKDIKSPLYLFFVAIEDEAANGKPVKELLRRKIKIDWTNDD